MPSRQRVIIGLERRANLYILDRDVPEIVSFGPPFGPALPALSTGAGPQSVWVCPVTNEIVVHADFVTGGIQFAHLPHNATSWTMKASPVSTARAYSIHGSDINNVWAVHGDTYDVSAYDGNNWVIDATLPTPGRCEDVFALNDNDVFIASHDGIWFRQSGAKGSGVWTNEKAQMHIDTGIANDAAKDCYWILAFAANDVYVGMANTVSSGYVLIWDGVSWSFVASARRAAGAQASAPGASPDIWFNGVWGGQRGRIHYFDGVSVATQASLTYPSDITTTENDIIMLNPTLGYGIYLDTFPDRWAVYETTDGSNWSGIYNNNPHELSGGLGLAIWLEAIALPTVDIDIDSVTVIAKDVIKVNFSSAVAVTASLYNPATYSLSSTDGGTDIDVKSVLPTSEGTTATSILLALSPKAVFGGAYQIDIESAGSTGEILDEDLELITDTVLFSPGGSPAGSMSFPWTHHRTKVDGVLDSLSDMYDKNLGGTLRTVVQAITTSDEEIGGDF